MKKIIIVLLSYFSSLMLVQAQTTLYVPGSVGSSAAPGKVGVGSGLSNPLTPLQVETPSGGGPANTTTPNQGLLLTGSTTNGALNLGVDASVSGSFYSWIQARSKAAATYYNLSLNPFGGFVGIGEKSPSAPLHVHSFSGNAGLRLSTQGKTTSIYLNVADGDYGFLSLGGLTELRGNGQSSSFQGKLGIGIAAPEELVHIKSTGNNQGLKIETVGKTSKVHLNVSDGDYGFLSLGGTMALRGNGQSSVFDGKVAIGGSSPLTSLHVISPTSGAGNSSVPNQGLLIGATGTEGALNFGVDPSINGSFYSWVQSRDITTSQFYNLSLNPHGGKVGVGTKTPESPLHVHAPNGNGGLKVTAEGKTTSVWLNVAEGNYGYLWLGGETEIRGNGQASHFEGSVGIGLGADEVDPNHKLDVNGIIHAEEVVVDLQVPGPDYVFEETYNLPTLTEVESYIKENKHLPEVPSAKQMEAEGLKLMEMNILLLKKVEELTLYMMEQNKINQRQAEEIKDLRSLIERLESER